MMKADRMRARFKEICFSEEIANMVVTPDALSAKIAEKLGFTNISSAGYGTAASRLAMPDRGIADFGLMCDNTREIVNAVNIPVFADGDTGYGDVENVQRLIRAYEDMGVAGVFLEDQTWPKRCGHMDGKTVIPTKQMVTKLKAAVAARRHADFMIMSRTDAYAVYGLDAAIERTKIYHAAGVDLGFVEAPKEKTDLQKITTSLPDEPIVLNQIENGKTPLLTNEEAQALGFSLVVHPTVLTYTQTYAVSHVLQDMLHNGSTAQDLRQMVTFPEFNRFIGLDEVNDIEEKYAAEEITL